MAHGNFKIISFLDREKMLSSLCLLETGTHDACKKTVAHMVSTSYDPEFTKEYRDIYLDLIDNVSKVVFVEIDMVQLEGKFSKIAQGKACQEHIEHKGYLSEKLQGLADMWMGHYLKRVPANSVATKPQVCSKVPGTELPTAIKMEPTASSLLSKPTFYYNGPEAGQGSTGAPAPSPKTHKATISRKELVNEMTVLFERQLEIRDNAIVEIQQQLRAHEDKIEARDNVIHQLIEHLRAQDVRFAYVENNDSDEGL